jgi:hypothetical protein
MLFRIGNRQTIRADRQEQKKMVIAKHLVNTFYYCLALPEYLPEFKATSASFKYVLDSQQSTAPIVGGFNAMSVRNMTDVNGTRDKNTILMFKGFRTPADTDGELDVSGNIVVRDLKRMYYEEYEVTSLDDKDNVIGSFGGQLHYVDSGDGTATQVPRLTFPITYATGIWKEYSGGYIDWKYFNTGLFLREMTMHSSINISV